MQGGGIQLTCLARMVVGYRPKSPAWSRRHFNLDQGALYGSIGSPLHTKSKFMQVISSQKPGLLLEEFRHRLLSDGRGRPNMEIRIEEYPDELFRELVKKQYGIGMDQPKILHNYPFEVMLATSVAFDRERQIGLRLFRRKLTSLEL
ncbi:hypothetical protein GX51_02462 [Blastomyces parvus]|uniref:Uncharacterized protein n=1 Tax=Blastomyces parvus TaxID=2060905 RepID=A0A2B7XBB0_9EURO|nr:hypothetical protein GX51_02462 [Blastomyces parvus]